MPLSEGAILAPARSTQRRRRGIAHHDPKPANLLITKQGIKLLDSIWKLKHELARYHLWGWPANRCGKYAEKREWD
jgi:hypothetical protein